MDILRLLLPVMLASWPALLLAQEPPSELARLREQFQKRVDTQIEPLRKVYLEELGKLERRLAQQGKLEEALQVKSERESMETLRRQPGDMAKANNKEALAKSLENTTWSYVADVPDKATETYYVILFERGRAFFSWDNSIGTWKATAANKIELICTVRKATSEMKVSADLSTWEGSYSLDAFGRAGQRVGATASR